MKKILLPFVAIPLLLASCSKDPDADFTASYTEVRIGEIVYFTNRSIDADNFEWDFGDGYISSTFNASHSYESEGIYNVSLKAFYKNNVDIATLTIRVIRNLEANFTFSSDEVGIGETINFTNTSTDADRYEWEFGDGFSSTNTNASHYYSTDGVYTVSLKAFYNGNMDEVYATINVLGASIEITVEEYYEPFYLVPDISVILYPTITDWENQTNAIEEKFTSASGVVRFNHLAPQRYYVDVWGPNHDNYKLAEEDAGFIETPVLVPGTITYWTALVDYYVDGKKSALSRFETKAKRKIDASGKTPRTITDRNK